MKQILLSTLLLFVSIGLFASDLANKKTQVKVKDSFKADKPIDISGFENGLSSNKIAETGNEYANESTAQLQAPIGEVIGLSTYDLQTNTGVCRRVALSSNNTFVHTSWTISQTYNLAAPDRGTGYNFYNRNTNVWQDIPASRIEPMSRTGWPSMGFTSSGRTYSITHTGDAGMMFCWRDGNQSEWTETIVGNIVGDIDGVWARAAVDGVKIHVAISRLGASFAGVDAGVNYIRSLDNGDTWESLGSFVPDYSEIYARMGGDAYQIDAKNGTVAFIFGDILTETDLYMSYDDGTTWERNTFVESSNPTAAYIDAELGFTVEPYWGTYGGNTVILDSQGIPHVVFSGALQFNPADNDWLGSSTYFPMFSSTALWYWNPTMEDPELIGKTVMNDANGDGVLGSYLASIENEEIFTGDMVGQPLLAIDAEDNLYVSYAAHVDGDWQPTELTIQSSLDGGVTLAPITVTVEEERILYKDVFMIKKQADSNDWEGPLNITQSSGTDDLYGSIQRDVVDNTLYLIYQSDSLAGNIFNGQNEVGTQNEQPVVAIDVSTINDAAAPADSEPYVLPIPWGEPFIVAQGCEITNDIFFSDFIVGMDYPEGFVPVELVGGIDYSVPGDYTEVLQAVDSQGNVSDTMQILISVVEDVTPPTLTVAVPCNDFAVLAGGDWENPEVEIFDDSFCDLEPLLQVQGLVDPNTVGVYTLIYNVSDYAGNAADPLTLNVSVIAADTDGPEVTFLNAPDTVAIYGVVPDIDFLVIDNVDCEITDYVVEGLDEVETSIPGVYTITVTATDSSGNESVATHTITITDNIAPSISLEDNPYTTDCGDDGTFDETDLPADFVEVEDNFSASGDLVVTSDFSTVDCSVDGEYEVEYTVTDEAGNVDDVTLTVIVSTTPIIGIDKYLADFVDLYPNPTQGLINVDVSDLKVTDINVYNVIGELVFSLPTNAISTNNNIDLSNQAEGIYMININTEEGSVTKKLTISK